MLSIYRAGEIDLFENLDIVHIRLLVVGATVGNTYIGGFLRMTLKGVPRKKKMLKGHPPRVIYH